MPAPRFLPPLELNADLHEALVRLNARHRISRSEDLRLKIILHQHRIAVNLLSSARHLGCHRHTVRTWHLRASEASQRWEEDVKHAMETPGHAGVSLIKERLAREVLADEPRSGRSPTYTPEQYTQIVAIAVRLPSEFNRPITHWTARELADEVHLQEIAPISARQVQRFLQTADLKPHRSRYWLNPKITSQPEFEQQVKNICELYKQVPTLHEQGVHVVSTDEKTGIQALERIAPTKLMKPGKPERQEAEYKRHGTLCLIPSFDVATGKIATFQLGETRNEDDFAYHIMDTIAADPQAHWIFVADQLNTHMSASLVELIAELIGYTGDLGVKEECGILHNLASRKAFLQDSSHRVRFVYTPKHCSWLNQVEIWFGVLVRKVIRRGNFPSKAVLHQKISEFIEYFNRTMAKPYRWTFSGFPLTA